MNKSKNSRRSAARRFTGMDLALFLLLTLFALSIAIPFWNVLITSLSPQKAYADNPAALFPAEFSLESYRYLFRDGKIVQGLKNTLVLEMYGLPLSLFLTTTMAYALSHKGFPGRKAIIALTTFTMIFNGGIVPMYLVMKHLNLTSSIWSVVFSNCFSVYNMILMINYFQSLPPSLIESARLDGANEWCILGRIVLPMSKPILATIALFYGVGFWNQWYDSMIFLRKANMMPLQNVLRSIIQETEIRSSTTGSLSAMAQTQFTDGIKMAAVFLTLIPILCLYPLLQKYFVKGITVGAVK